MNKAGVISKEIAIWLVRAEAASSGQLLAEQLDGIIYRGWEHDAQSHATQKEFFAVCYGKHRQWVFVGATGIAVRFAGGLIEDKKSDPALVVLDEGRHHAIVLVGGHEGGANELAYRVANITGATPVVTTATEAIKPLTVGIGCRKGVSAEAIEEAVLSALGRIENAQTAQQILACQIRQVATIDLKANEPGLLQFCKKHKLPLRVIGRESVHDRSWVTEPSKWVEENAGVVGVCEPCALIAGAHGRLVVPKFTHDGVAVAVVDDSFTGTYERSESAPKIKCKEPVTQ